RKRTGIGIVSRRPRFDARKRRTPSTGLAHQEGLKAYRTRTATTPPTSNVKNARRSRRNAVQTRNGSGKNQPVSFVSAAQPAIIPEGDAQPRGRAWRAGGVDTTRGLGEGEGDTHPEGGEQPVGGGVVPVGEEFGLKDRGPGGGRGGPGPPRGGEKSQNHPRRE